MYSGGLLLELRLIFRQNPEFFKFEHMDDLDQLFAANIAKINYEGKDAEAISCKAKEMLRLMNMKLPHGSLRKVYTKYMSHTTLQFTCKT